MKENFLASTDPIALFHDWFEGQKLKNPYSLVNAVSLSTVNSDGWPSIRVVLFKSYEDGFIFFTNYDSPKAQDLEQNPKLAMTFHWEKDQRQIRIQGLAEKTSREKSVEYWNKRPRKSQISGKISPQGQTIPSFDWMRQQFTQAEKKLEGEEIPCPENWGGYCLRPKKIEFWQGQENRLHQRVVFEKKENEWQKSFLGP